MLYVYKIVFRYIPSLDNRSVSQPRQILRAQGKVRRLVGESSCGLDQQEAKATSERKAGQNLKQEGDR